MNHAETLNEIPPGASAAHAETKPETHPPADTQPNPNPSPFAMTETSLPLTFTIPMSQLHGTMNLVNDRVRSCTPLQYLPHIPTEPGAQRGKPGRPKGRKKKMTAVSLTPENVQKAKVLEGNFSGLIDRLLAEWLGRALPSPSTRNNCLCATPDA